MTNTETENDLKLINQMRKTFSGADKWCQKNMRDNHGRKCLLACFADSIREADLCATDSVFRVQEAIYDEIGYAMIFWNDEPQRTFEDVRLLCDRVAARFEEQNEESDEATVN